MRVVIVGSEGFVGKELKRQCRTKNIEVITIDSVSSDDPNHVVADIRSKDIDSAIPQQVDALVHLAAISQDEDCRANPHLAFDVNVLGTLNLIRAAKRRGARQFIFASSEWVYGEVIDGALQTEEQVIDATKIQSEYALSKIVGEQALKLAHQRDLCPVTILRFGIIYGTRPDNGSAVESLFHAVGTGETISVGSLDSARRFIHVSDIAEGICSAIGRSDFEIFNLSGDRLITLRDVIEESGQLLRRSPEVRETNPGSASVRNPDNRKARTELGWAPTLDLKAGLTSLMVSAGEPESRESSNV